MKNLNDIVGGFINGDWVVEIRYCYECGNLQVTRHSNAKNPNIGLKPGESDIYFQCAMCVLLRKLDLEGSTRVIYESQSKTTASSD